MQDLSIFLQETFVFDFYLECLIKEFNGDKTKVPYTVEQLRISYNYVFLANILFVISTAVRLLNGIEENDAKKDVYFDYAELNIRQACEDAVELLDGEMRDVFEKYGL